MNPPDEDVVLRATEDARRILGEYIAPESPWDATSTIERLLAVLDRDEVVHALDRMTRRRTHRLVERNGTSAQGESVDAAFHASEDGDEPEASYLTHVGTAGSCGTVPRPHCLHFAVADQT